MENFTSFNKKEYFAKLINKVYRLLPIYEGKQVGDGTEDIPPIQAQKNYVSELIVLATKIAGDYDIYGYKPLLYIVSLLHGMKHIDVGQQNDVKVCVFNIIKFCKAESKDESN